jgi:hypothetical protein
LGEGVQERRIAPLVGLPSELHGLGLRRDRLAQARAPALALDDAGALSPERSRRDELGLRAAEPLLSVTEDELADRARELTPGATLDLSLERSNRAAG